MKKSMVFGSYTPLFPVPLLGAGTWLVESLPSYLNRLGAAHGVSAMALCLGTLFPRIGGKLNRYNPARLIAGKRAVRLLHPTSLSTSLMNALEECTGQQGIHRAVAGTLSDVVDVKRDIRPSWWWCAACIQAWISAGQPVYFPLIWNLKTYRICVEHKARLIGACPRCGFSVYPMREQNWSVCCRACGHSQLPELGRNQNSGDDDKWDLECSIRTQEALALAADGRQISKKNFHENLNTAVSAVGSAYRVAKSIGLDRHCIARWKDGDLPRFGSLVYLSARFGIPFATMFEGSPKWTFSTVAKNFQPPNLYPRRGNEELQALEFALQEAVSSPPEARASVNRLCAQLKVGKATLVSKYPELTSQLVAKHREEVQKQKATRRCENLSLLAGVAQTLTAEGSQVTRHRIRMVMKQQGDERVFQVLRLFKELSTLA